MREADKQIRGALYSKSRERWELTRLSEVSGGGDLQNTSSLLTWVLSETLTGAADKMMERQISGT